MDITIKCQLSLSKKLRSLIQEGEARIALVAPNITDGRGEANLVISSDKKINTNVEFIGKETSIMLVPVEMADVTIEDSTVGTLFTKNARVQPNKKRSAVDRMAVMDIDEDDEEAHSIKTKEEITEEIPETFAVTKEPAYRNYIESLAELDKAIAAAKNKVSDIDPDSIQDPRKRAEAMEIKEKLESIDVDAFIVNDKCANLAINDLGINLVLNNPYNLSNISARRLLGSKELKSMFNAKLVKFIKPEEVSFYMNRAVRAIEKPTLDVYSSPEEAEDHMARAGMNVEKIELSVSGLDGPTESEMLLTNLTSGPVASKTGGVTRTVHGNSPATRKTVGEKSQENTKGLKTIRRTGLSY